MKLMEAFIADEDEALVGTRLLRSRVADRDAVWGAVARSAAPVAALNYSTPLPSLSPALDGPASGLQRKKRLLKKN